MGGLALGPKTGRKENNDSQYIERVIGKWPVPDGSGQGPKTRCEGQQSLVVHDTVRLK